MGLFDGFGQPNTLPLRIPVPGLRHELRSGDALESAFSFLGVPSCLPCRERRDWLNDHIVLQPLLQKNNGDLG